MNVSVEDHPQTGLGFYRAPSVSPIPLTIVDDTAGAPLV
ncbi:MAG: hypothetical protein JWR32_4584 [Mycobacterium sp.]|jgi:hypothetical protein|nr:hypothetical protein [Mycobacterium sp.]